jgi:3-hydroxyisobutyrate dehydrogenase-like beta-hydroxyacid dehydrogenase
MSTRPLHTPAESSADRPIGLIGLGHLGGAIAHRVCLAFASLGYDSCRAHGELASRTTGIELATSIDGLAAARAVILALPQPEISLEVCRELAGLLRPGTVVIECSTVTPASVAECGEILSVAGISLVDAGVIGGVDGMRTGRATLLVGGAGHDIAQVADIFDAISDSRIHFGALGSGMAAKVANNAVGHAVMVVLLEAASICAAYGVDLREFAALLTHPGAGLSRPLTHRLAYRVFERDFEAGMSTHNARKDSLLALELARDRGVPVIAIGAAHTVYDIAVASGLGQYDYATIAQLWEQWTGRDLRPAAATKS